MPVQVVVPLKDSFLSPDLVDGLDSWVEDLTVIQGGHRPLVAGHPAGGVCGTAARKLRQPMTAAQRTARWTAVDRPERNVPERNGLPVLGQRPEDAAVHPGRSGECGAQGLLRRMFRRQFGPYLDAGYSVWIVTRRRNMPAGHTMADMADDYARVITEEFGGQVDVVVAESFGGMIGQYLAALHPGAFGRIVLVIAAAELSDWGKDVDSRMADALAAGDPEAPGRSSPSTCSRARALAGCGNCWDP